MWQRYSAGEGAKGHRYYDWGRMAIADATEHACHPPPPGQIPLTRSEIASLFGTLVIEPVRDARHRLRWSA